MELYKIICSTNWNRLGHLKLWTKFQEWNKTEISCCTVCLSILIKFSRYFRGTHRLNTLGCRLTFWSAPPNFSLLNSDSFRMSSAFKSTIYENSRIHDNQVHAYGHVHGRWKTKQRITLIPKLRSDRKLFWPPFCSCLCFRCLVRCISSFQAPGKGQVRWSRPFYRCSSLYARLRDGPLFFWRGCRKTHMQTFFYIYTRLLLQTIFQGSSSSCKHFFLLAYFTASANNLFQTFPTPPPSPVKK